MCWDASQGTGLGHTAPLAVAGNYMHAQMHADAHHMLAEVHTV